MTLKELKTQLTPEVYAVILAAVKWNNCRNGHTSRPYISECDELSRAVDALVEEIQGYGN